MLKDGYGNWLVFAFVMTIIFIIIYQFKLRYVDELNNNKRKKWDWIDLALILGVTFVIKMILAVKFKGYETDMNCFYGWSDMIFDGGISNFYKSDSFTDYPPGYMFLLWIIAGIRKLFGIETVSGAGRALIKLFPLVFELASSFVIYKIAKEKFSEVSSQILAVLYALNPLVVLDSSIWGQVDGVFTFFVLLTSYLCMKKKRVPAYFIFILGVLIKPQTLIFSPILIWTIIEQVFMTGKINIKDMLKELFLGLSAIASFFILCIPFGVEEVISQYLDTIGSYKYCTINAFNIWALLGKNWASQDDMVLFLPAHVWGSIAIVLAIIISTIVFFMLSKKNDKSRYYISSAILISTVFLFGVRMHERYLFPAIALILCAYILKPTKEMYISFVGYTIIQFISVSYVLFFLEKYESTLASGGLVGIIALSSIAFYIYLFYAIFKKPEVEVKEKKKKIFDIDINLDKIQASYTMPKFNKKDWAILIAILCIYIPFALHDLGNMHAPQTQWNSKELNSEIVLDMGSEIDLDMIYTYLGNYENRNFYLDLSKDGKNFERLGGAEKKVCAKSVFTWNRLNLEDKEGENSYNLTNKYRYIKLTSQDDKSSLNELVILDKEGKKHQPINKDDYKELFDEQDEYKDFVTFREGTYFDEIYHARTAFEMDKNIYNYENTHPPFGKFLISLGIKAFGMTPFGWRIVGTLFGIFMIPLMYLFGRRLFAGKSWLAGIMAFIFSFDFMHFTQTRISTIDVYGTFFIIAMYYFMYKYSQISFYDTKLYKTFIPLGISAIMMGLGCASKWTGVYAAAGLGVFFFVIITRRIREYIYAKKNPDKKTNGIDHNYIVKSFRGKLIKTLGFCVLFFLIIAPSIYLASYIPFNDSDDIQTNERRFWYVLEEGNPGKYPEAYINIAKFLVEADKNANLEDDYEDNYFIRLTAKMVKNQVDMYKYHSELEASHPYASNWYEWPFDFRPMFFYSDNTPDNKKEGISSFGNPLIWLLTIPLLLFMLYRLFLAGSKESDRIIKGSILLATYTLLALFALFTYLFVKTNDSIHMTFSHITLITVLLIILARIFMNSDKRAGFIVLGFLAQYVPWMMVPRCMFAYHFFPSVPFVVMMIVYTMSLLVKKNDKWKKWVFIYCIGVFVLFLLFYPVLAGQAVEDSFVRDGLRWMDSWVLVS